MMVIFHISKYIQAYKSCDAKHGYLTSQISYMQEFIESKLRILCTLPRGKGIRK